MLSKTQVAAGVGAVLAQFKQDKSHMLLDEAELIFLRFKVKKVADQRKFLRLGLTHSINHDTRDVCLFVKDLDTVDRDYEKTVRHYQEILDQAGVKGISKIIPLKALRTDYSVEEAMTGLSQAFDLYLADDRIVTFLPKLLGHKFYGKLKSVPVSANMRSKQLKLRLENLIDNSRCNIDRRSSCLAIVANAKMSEDEIVDNVMAAGEKILNTVPGGPRNIMTLELKMTVNGCLPIPIYANFDPADEVVFNLKRKRGPETYTDEITTINNAQVEVRPEGRVKVVKMPRRSKSTSEENENATDDVTVQSETPKLEKRFDGYRPMNMTWEERRVASLATMRKMVAGEKANDTSIRRFKKVKSKDEKLNSLPKRKVFVKKRKTVGLKNKDKSNLKKSGKSAKTRKPTGTVKQKKPKKDTKTKWTSSKKQKPVTKKKEKKTVKAA